MRKIILHLCAKEGSDSKPYRDAGYDVRIIGEEIGVENYTPPKVFTGLLRILLAHIFRLREQTQKIREICVKECDL